MRKIRYLAFVVMLLTIYFSNTPDLVVSDPHTWTNTSKYEELKLYSFLSSDSVFFEPWGDFRNIDFYLHKLSHITFYALIGFFLLYKSASALDVCNKLLFIFIFALSDEIHQYFVVGRSGRLIDSCLDMLSVFFVLMALIISRKLIDKPNKKEGGELI